MINATKYENKTPLGEMDPFRAILFLFNFFGCLESIHFLILNYFSQLLFHVASTPARLPRPMKVTTSSRLYPDYFNVAYFPPTFSLLNTVSEATSGTLPLTMQ